MAHFLYWSQNVTPVVADETIQQHKWSQFSNGQFSSYGLPPFMCLYLVNCFSGLPQAENFSFSFHTLMTDAAIKSDDYREQVGFVVPQHSGERQC